MTRETVLKDTPASRATSLMVAIFKSLFHLDAHTASLALVRRGAPSVRAKMVFFALFCSCSTTS